MKGPFWPLVTDAAADSETMGDDYDYDAPDSVHGIPYEDFPDFEPNFHTVVVVAGAPLTDLVTSVPIPDCGYLVGPKLRAVLERFTLPRHRFYPVRMTHRRKPVAGYSWLHLPAPRLPMPNGVALADVEAGIRADPELADADLIRFYDPRPYAYTFASAPLRAAVEAAGVTGVEFTSKKTALFRPPA